MISDDLGVHMRTCRRQAVKGWRIVFRIYAVDLGATETSEHSECGSPVLAPR